jgi:hypothetical protein
MVIPMETPLALRATLPDDPWSGQSGVTLPELLRQAPEGTTRNKINPLITDGIVHPINERGRGKLVTFDHETALTLLAACVLAAMVGIALTTAFRVVSAANVGTAA